jgi:lipoprotein-anchoring transpeptidase ErfK/SrfK
VGTAVAPSGPVLAIISLPVQRCSVYRNGVLIGVSTVSTGKAGHRTPTGVFTVLQKHIDHRSNLYNSAPMPYMQRLTWTGIAMHAGNLPGFPASHGCVRMPLTFAKRAHLG